MSHILEWYQSFCPETNEEVFFNINIYCANIYPGGVSDQKEHLFYFKTANKINSSFPHLFLRLKKTLLSDFLSFQTWSLSLFLSTHLSNFALFSLCETNAICFSQIEKILNCWGIIHFGGDTHWGKTQRDCGIKRLHQLKLCHRGIFWIMIYLIS